ncbi:diguanylate cyclase [Pyxidicoccus fallax]|uniref:diguanylate cyclase n=1 Tax=Pyxidicoccus fallax TaxID=394095 RepID=A0A848LRW0_9BACT|nr:diguanylate cyclase [Pyxidicoccus fallax]NMO20421.1 diguanylate cyclase [Pyxidicoccus fallax]NPC85027.1 diguanylate cyclase [Pyxidicoccus fallax]
MERRGRTSGRSLLLVIEDDVGVRESLMDLLASRFDVLAASDADAGVELAREHRPDLILLDRFLPSGDGLMVLESLQRDARTEAVPVIFLTGDADEATLERCLEMGAVDFIHKPASARELLARIDRALRQSEQQRRLQILAQTDALTGLANFRALTVRLEEEFRRAQRYQYPLSVVVIDLDHLKAINDGLGHDVGNRAILALASQLKGNLRESDFAARFGGDEFVAILPHQTALEAAVFAERIRAGLRTVGVQKSDGRPAPFGLSVSVGIADHTLEGPKEDTDALLKAADAALYEAKREGRDRVVVFGRPADSPPVQRH